MSIECSECERDLRGGHAEDCSRHPTREMVRVIGCLGDLFSGETFDQAELDRLQERLTKALDRYKRHYEITD